METKFYHFETLNTRRVNIYRINLWIICIQLSKIHGWIHLFKNWYGISWSKYKAPSPGSIDHEDKPNTFFGWYFKLLRPPIKLRNFKMLVPKEIPEFMKNTPPIQYVNIMSAENKDGA